MKKTSKKEEKKNDLIAAEEAQNSEPDAWTKVMRARLIEAITDGQTVYQIAKLSGVSQTAIHEFSRGVRSTLTLPVACRLGQALGLAITPAKKRRKRGVANSLAGDGSRAY